MSEPSLTRRVGISSLWTVGTRIVIQLISLVSMIVLARWLGPAQTGLFEKTAIIVSVLELLSALGLETALVQRQTLERKHYDTAWTLNIMRGALMALVMVLLSFRADEWFHAPGLGAILPWLALMPLMQGFENTGMVDIRRNFAFGVEFKWMVGRRIVSFVIAMSLAWYLRSVWALVCASVGSVFASMVLSYILSPYRPRFSLAGWPDLRQFVSWFFGYTTIVAFSGKVDELLLLRFATPMDVAFYRRATDFAVLPSTELAAPMVRALIPALAKMRDTPDERRHLFVKFLSLVMLVAIPCCTGLALLADPLVRVLLGDRWLPTIELMPFIAIGGMTRAYQTCAESAFLASNRVDVHAKFTAAAMLWRFPIMTYGLIYHGVKGLAIAMVVATLISLIVNIFVHRHMGTFGLRDIGRSLWRIIGAVGLMSVAVLMMKPYLAHQSAFLQLIVLSMIGAVVYILFVWITWQLSGKPDSAEAMVFEQVARRFQKIFG
jgi:lipopolysaccharide exporter